MQPATESVLLNRLIDAYQCQRRVVFLVGAGLSLPPGTGAPGVPGANEIIRRVEHRLRDSGADLPDSLGTPGALAYQEALEIYRRHRGQRGLDELVREAVLEACPGGNSAAAAAARGGDLAACLDLEQITTAWALPPGVEALGRLIARFSGSFGQAVLTTNFDPLVEVAIRKAGGQSHTSFLAEDGRISTRYGDGCHVIHVHGFWSGHGYTAHTVAQLSRPRPKLRRDLERLLEHSDLVVLAYGGWQDVFSELIASLLIDPAQHTEVLWCFLEKSWAKVEARYAPTLERLAPGFDTVVVPYFGIDANLFLVNLERRLRVGDPYEAIKTGLAAEMGAGAIVNGLAGKEVVAANSAETEVPPPTRANIASQQPRVHHNPFIVGPPILSDTPFFGREQQKDQIFNALKRWQPIQLVGERRMGKTSLLHWAKRNIHEVLPNWPVAWIDAGALACRSPAALIQAIQKNRTIDVLGRTEPFVEDAIPIEAALERLLPLILLVDEASALAAPGHEFDATFLGQLRAAGQNQRLAWLSTSHADLHGLFMEDHLTSPFLNDSLIVSVGSLSSSEAIALLSSGLTAEQATLTIETAGTLPYPLQWFANSLFEGLTPDQAGDSFRAGLKPHFDSWWRWRNGHFEEQNLLRRCVSALGLAGLEPVDRMRLRQLVNRGLVLEGQGRFTLNGAAWREYVAERNQDSND